MLGRLRALLPVHSSFLPAMRFSVVSWTQKRGIRFKKLGENLGMRAKDRRAEYMRRRYPRLGPLVNLEPDAKLYRVRLIRSPRRLPKKIRMSAQTLGFGKDKTKYGGITRHKTVWVPQTALFAGRILKIKELVSVSLCTEADRLQELAYIAGRRDRMKGYEVIGRASDMTDI